MEVTRDIIQLIFTPVMLLVILGYQYYRIKHLKKQLDAHDKLLTSIQTYFDILDPELFKQRVEMYEKILEEKKSFEIDKMESQISETTRGQYLNAIGTATEALSRTFIFVPHSRRIEIVNNIEDDYLRGILEDILESVKETDKKFKNVAAIHLLSNENDAT